MTDQEKREKVLRGLSAHVNGHPHTRCHKCPYWGTGPHGSSECSELAADALALLKAQEPRVMTLEEYKVWADIPFCERDPIFLEMKSRRGAETWWINTAECSIENYGKTERCWIARPDEKVRQETPWE